ncbi:HDIG domain-containing protein [bacterium]|nr:HDIG domain-containing protein [bacterium]
MLNLPKILVQIAEKITQAGGTPILVGGAVRDHLLGLDSKDLDIEVFGLTENQLVKILRNYGPVLSVGKAFGVLKLSINDEIFDFSLPRKEIKTGAGHKGFDIETDPDLTFRQASSRRDFTINAMGYDIQHKKILDEFDGGKDLENRILRVVDPKTFADDPLRVLRGIQFAARFQLNVTDDTLSVFKSLVKTLSELPTERIFEELKKLLLKAEKPSIGFQLADKAGVIEKLFPELYALHAIPQDPEWHPEGDVWAHTMMVIDEAAKLKNNNEFHDLSLMLAALCHDFGKPATTSFADGRWRSLKHTEAGVEPTKIFLDRLTNEQKLMDNVMALVKEHLQPAQLFQSSKVTDGAIRRLSLRVDIPLLLKVAQADHFGRLDEEARKRVFPAGQWLSERFNELELADATKVHPILMGRHLLDLGMKPGPKFGLLLNEAFELQLDDNLNSLEDAIEWAKKRIQEL